MSFQGQLVVSSFTMCSLNDALTLLDVAVAPNRLSSVQELVFRQSWLGKSYRDMARAAGYDADYLRVVGGQLWQTLSQILGERITKKNICAVMRQYAQNITENINTKQSLTGPPIDLTQVESPGGSVGLNSRFYIERPPLEQSAFAELTKPGAFLKIKGARLMGKTSLMTRLLAHGESMGYSCVRVNLQQADRAILTHPEKFLRWFCANLSWQLQGESRLDEFWDTTLGSKLSCTRFMHHHLLESLQQPCAIAVDELDCLYEYPETAAEFLPLLRIWHEEASHLEVWQKLRLVVAYTADRHPCFQAQLSLLNTGITLHLRDFNLSQLQDLAYRYGLDERLPSTSLSPLERLQSLIGGHPYLVRLAFYGLCQDLTLWDRLFENALLPHGIFGAHLQENLVLIQDQPELSAAFKRVLVASTPAQLNALLADRLQSLGLVKLELTGVTPYCELYRLYFCDRL